MSNGIDKLATELQKTVLERDKNQKRGYDTEATVLKVDDGIAWVKIPGGVDETPAQMTINASEGDKVMVRVSGGRAFLIGNGTNPPTDNSVANQALYIGETAGAQAQEAIENSAAAKIAASQASDAADVAQEMAQAATVSAIEAQEMAQEATESAGEAAQAASEAKDSAATATNAATSALTQLSVVEDVVGTVNWISDHGTYSKTEDTEIDPNKTYFIKINNVYTPVAQPDKSQLKQYYELSLDESVQNYISTHLALTDEGLYVIKDDLGYKVLLANDGMKVYDADGKLVSTFGEYIRFSSEKPQYIGSDDAYIIFDPNTGQINIGGNVVLGGDLTLDKLLSEVNSLEVEYTLNEDSSIAHFEAHILRGHEEVTTEFDPRCFTWYYKTEDGEREIVNSDNVNYGYTMDVNINDLFDYEGHIITHFTHSYVNYYIENGRAYADAEMIDSDNLGEFGFIIDEYGDLIYSYDDKTVADFDINNGRLRALNQYGIFGNRLTRETAVYKKGALAAALASKADNQDFFQATQDIYIQAISAVDTPSKYDAEWVTYEGESVDGTPPDAATGQAPKWTLKRPTYQKNYPVIFIAKQTLTKKADGTLEISCTTPLMDDSQTIIDGGHIITGTIDAAKLNAANINSSGTLTIGAMSSDTQNEIRNSNLAPSITEAAKTATTYITTVDNNGIKVHAANNPDSNYSKIDADGLEVYKDTSSVAKFGSTSRIGPTSSVANSSHLEILPAKMTLYGVNEKKYEKQLITVGDARGTVITNEYTGDGTATSFNVSVYWQLNSETPEDFSVYIDDTLQTKDTDYTLNLSAYTMDVNFTTAPAAGSIISVRYTVSDPAPYMTMGSRINNSSVQPYTLCVGIDNQATGTNSTAIGLRCSATGAHAHAEGWYSNASGRGSHAEGSSSTASNDAAHAEGYGSIASGRMSHAEGYYATASGLHSHAEGGNTTASGYSDHAEGRYSTASGGDSHAEGYGTVASGGTSHAEGAQTEASGYYSHAQNLGTKAAGYAQTAIGMYNADDANALFIIGNGAYNARNSSLAARNNGDLIITGTLTQLSDRRVKEHIDYLGEDAVEFVRDLKPAHFIKDGVHHVGFYAQDVNESDKWDCMTDEMNGRMTLSYTEIIAPLVSYCQHLEERIKELEEAIIKQSSI